MRTDWAIRPATQDDAQGLQDCMPQAYAPCSERLGGTLLPPMELDYRQEIRDYPTWVVVHEEQIVGGMTMMFTGPSAAIANVAVHPDSQGLGIGKGLLKFAETEAKSRQANELKLATHVALTENLSL